MMMLTTWSPQRWSPSRSWIASSAASTIRRFCSTVIPSVLPYTAHTVPGVYRWRKVAQKPLGPGEHRQVHGGFAFGFCGSSTEAEPEEVGGDRRGGRHPRGRARGLGEPPPP